MFPAVSWISKVKQDASELMDVDSAEEEEDDVEADVKKKSGLVLNQTPPPNSKTKEGFSSCIQPLCDSIPLLNALIDAYTRLKSAREARDAAEMQDIDEDEMLADPSSTFHTGLVMLQGYRVHADNRALLGMPVGDSSNAHCK